MAKPDPSSRRPAAAPATTDAESGTEAIDVTADLRALEAMRQRGLIDQQTYESRRRALLRQSGGG